jgi:hypothetical protein
MNENFSNEMQNVTSKYFFVLYSLIREKTVVVISGQVGVVLFTAGMELHSSYRVALFILAF